jgi:hypothetical protein
MDGGKLIVLASHFVLLWAGEECQVLMGSRIYHLALTLLGTG